MQTVKLSKWIIFYRGKRYIYCGVKYTEGNDLILWDICFVRSASVTRSHTCVMQMYSSNTTFVCNNV